MSWRDWALCCACLTGLVACTARIDGRDLPDQTGDDGAGGETSPGQGGGGSVGNSGGAGGMAAATLPLAPLAMVRLSRAEYEHSVRDLFGADVLGNAGTLLDRDHVTAGSIALGSREVAVSRDGVRAYRDAAEAIAARAVSSSAFRATYAGCLGAPLDAGCVRTVVSRVGRRLYRRPLSQDEAARWVRVVTDVGAGDPWAGVEAAMTGMLLSPTFTHRVERGRADGGRIALTDHELASRLAYLLWDTTPDEALLAAADRGGLAGAAFASEVDRLLGDAARVREGVRAAFDDVLGLQRVETVAKDPDRFTFDAPALRASMREGTLRLIEAVLLERKGSLLDLYDVDVAYVDARLAPLYGLPAGEPGFRAVALPAEGARGGILTEPSLLAAHAGVALTSPTFRGKFVREHLLCSPVPAPPPNVNNNLPATVTGRTRRQQLESHMTNPSCATCHRAIDPIGFGLEGFDAMGRVQSQDNGVDVDASGELDGQRFEGARGLARAVGNHPRAAACLAGHVATHATGVVFGEDDEAAAAALITTSQGRVEPLLRALVLSDAFRFAATR